VIVPPFDAPWSTPTYTIRVTVPAFAASVSLPSRPFPTFSEIYVAALKTLNGEIERRAPASSSGMTR